MSGLIGYYVHHQGEGHRQRAAAIAAAYRGPMTLIGTGLANLSGRLPCLDLPDDRLPQGGFDGADGTTRPPALHYAPLRHNGVRQRVAMIADWIATAQPDLMIVDVSVEIAMLARLASVPFVYVRLHGRRDDRPHSDAFASAHALLAPFAKPLEDFAAPDWVKAKTFYAPGIGSRASLLPVERDRVLVVVGRGGQTSDGERWAEAAAAVPERRWRVIGPSTMPTSLPENLEMAGWVDDAEPEIASAGVVIGAAGDGLVSAVLAHARPFICLPEPRAFQEQKIKAERLVALDAAIVMPECPPAKQWRALIEAAERQPGKRPSDLHVSDGAGQAARWLEHLITPHHEALKAVS